MARQPRQVMTEPVMSPNETASPVVPRRRRRLHFYRDRAGKFRWTLFASNGRKVDAATQGYARKGNALRNGREVDPNAREDFAANWDRR